MASRRIATFGLKPMVGDLVLPPGAATDMDATDTDNMEQGTGRVKQRNWQQYSVVFNFDVLGVWSEFAFIDFTQLSDVGVLSICL